MDHHHETLAAEHVGLEAEVRALEAEVAFMEKAIDDLEAENKALNSSTPSIMDCAKEQDAAQTSSIEELLEVMDDCPAMDDDARVAAKAQILDGFALVLEPAKSFAAFYFSKM